MGARTHGRGDGQLSLYDEAALLTRLSERQTKLVSELLQQAAEATHVSEEKARLERDLAGSLDRLQEVHHRVRNHLQTVTGLLSAQEIGEKSLTARRALQKSVERLTSIAAIHDLLARDPSSGLLRLPELAQTLARHLLRQSNAGQRLRIVTDVSPLSLNAKRATAFVLVLTELVSNAIEHGFEQGERGEISVRVAQQGEAAVLEVRDSGRGLPPGFDIEAGNSLGLRLVARLAERDLNGLVETYNDGGACFRVVFPLEFPEENQ